MKQNNLILSRLLFITIAVFLFSSCGKDPHFLTDKSYRLMVQADFEARKVLAGDRTTELFFVFNDKTLTHKEKEALQFLYAYMPLSDLADYDGKFFLDQVRYAFKAQDEMPWGAAIPEDIFRHFVLVYRVNNEDLDTARMVIFNELKDRIRDMSMYDAALEINHWCHEKVTYRPSDRRTSSPLATIRTGFGRCGEESTLTVTAMRAMGIPARQIYTPRWAHTNSNHAWVEVWVNGNWHFLGACEPDPELDMGWFALPVTRAMMVHTNVFGKSGDFGERTLETELYSVVNLTSNYTNTKKIKVIVVDKNNMPVQDAIVKFKLYNFAEYYSLASTNTDKDGVATLSTGYGDLLVWVTKNRKYGYQKFDVRKNDELTIRLENEQGKEYVEWLDIFPPDAGTKKKVATKEQNDINNRRLQYNDSVRNAYLTTFMNEEDAKIIKTENLTPEQVWYFIQKSEGNYAEIKKFVEQNGKKRAGLYVYEFLNALSDKDLRDAPADILQEHTTLFDSKKYPFDVYVKGIIPARISNEGLRMWRHYLLDNLEAELGENATSQQLLDWMDANIRLRSDDNYFRASISPKGVYDLRLTDEHSRNIFFVAACRALDIPAYLDAATNQIFVWQNKKWNVVDLEEEGRKEKVAGTKSPSNFEGVSRGSLYGNLTLTLPKNAKTPEYWTHYTIAKFADGDFVTFNYQDDPRVAAFPATLELEPGYYMLSTGNRYSDGETLSQLEFFNIEPGKTVSKTVTLRKLIPQNKTYGEIEVNSPYSGKEHTLALIDLMQEKELILCFIDPAREPTRHLFNDMAALKNDFDKWGGNILFMIPGEKNTADFNPKRWNLPVNSIFEIDKESMFMNYVLNTTNQEFREEYPLVFIVNKEGKLVFKSEGYRIGTGELLLKSLKN
ncbi:MAG: transglutaminase-like domain-containing protein [Bacteroidetes bacterium]|nr:transglutaminase-like domain-containing protein [Bacteroidota bacterium]MCL2301868.1 transglutaminase-like domain-containing protein [Lentimicrobiaceae bacterium]